ncbi:MAG: alpha/beta hydrolase, partial [Kineosporiaceae bacterium]
MAAPEACPERAPEAAPDAADPDPALPGPVPTGGGIEARARAIRSTTSGFATAASEGWPAGTGAATAGAMSAGADAAVVA